MGSGCTQRLGTNNNSGSVCELYSDPVSSNYISFHLCNDFISWGAIRIHVLQERKLKPREKGRLAQEAGWGLRLECFSFPSRLLFC